MFGKFRLGLCRTCITVSKDTKKNDFASLVSSIFGAEYGGICQILIKTIVVQEVDFTS